MECWRGNLEEVTEAELASRRAFAAVKASLTCCTLHPAGTVAADVELGINGAPPSASREPPTRRSKSRDRPLNQPLWPYLSQFQYFSFFSQISNIYVCIC